MVAGRGRSDQPAGADLTAREALDAVEATLAAEQKRKARPRTRRGVELRLADVHVGNLSHDASGHWSFRVIIRPEDAEQVVNIPQFFGHRTDLALGADVVWAGRSKRVEPLPKELATRIEQITMNESAAILEIQRHGSHRDRRELAIRLAGLFFKATAAVEGAVEEDVRSEIEAMYAEQRTALHLVEEGEAAGG